MRLVIAHMAALELDATLAMVQAHKIVLNVNQVVSSLNVEIRGSVNVSHSMRK